MKQQTDVIHNYGDIKIYVTLYYEQGYSIDETLGRLDDSLNKNLDFYKDCKNLPTELNLTLLTRRSEYDDVLGRPSSVWGSGITRDNNIYTFHPDRRAIETSHSKESFGNTLTHEICHVFSKNIYGQELWWAREGVAQYIAGQNKLMKLEPNNIDHFILHSLYRNIPYFEFVNEHQGHHISRKMGYAIAELYGPTTLRSLLEINPVDKDTKFELANRLQTTSESLDKKIRDLLLKNDLKQAEYSRQ
jgi:hypothetical protein